MVTPPYGSSAGGAQRRGRCRHRPLRPAGGREGGTPGSSCPTGGCGEPPRLPWPAAHSGASAPAGARKWVGIAAEIIPKGVINLGQSLSRPPGDSSLYTREPLGRGFGPPRSSAPTDATLVAQAAGHAEGTESPSNHPSQRRRAKRLRQRSQGIGKNRSSGRRKGVLRDYRGSALSAEREAGQIQVLPDD